MRRTFKIVLAILVIAIASLCFLKVAVYVVALREQHRAEKLLAVVVRLQPGVTTADELQRDVFPSDSQFGKTCDSEKGEPSRADYENIPSWKLFTNEHTPEWVRNFETDWILPRWTMFFVSLECSAGLLSKMRVGEMQSTPEWIHGFGGFTEVFSKGSPANAGSGEPRSQDRDYWIWERGTGVYEGEHLDHLVRQSPALNRFVFINPDATAEEKRRSLSFNLKCFTRDCQNVNSILDAAPARP